MIGATFCSGIGAPEMAAPWIDWQLASEIEAFPREVLAHRFGLGDARYLCKGPRLWGDFTSLRPRHFRALNIPLPEIIVAGTPCQSFSVAGLRGGLDDDRGNLTLQFVRTCHAIQSARPDGRLIVLWENVPGVLSDKGNAFGAFLGGMVGSMDALPRPGNGAWAREGMVQGPRARAAWAVLDAQWFGVAQRRRRVFALFDFGNAVDPAAVLFDRDSLRGDSPPGRETGQIVAPTISARPSGGGGLGTDFDLDGGLISSTGNVAHCLNAGGMGRQDYETETMVAHPIAIQERAVSQNLIAGPDGAGFRQDGAAYTLEARQQVQAVAFAENSRGEVRLQGGKPGQGQACIAFDTTQITSGQNYSNPKPGDACHPLAAQGHPPAIAHPWAVRRLTARECERLQGLLDDHTLIPRAKNRPMKDLEDEIAYLRTIYPEIPEKEARRLAADGPRYKALGNSMAVPVVRWILGRVRISAQEMRRVA